MDDLNKNMEELQHDLESGLASVRQQITQLKDKVTTDFSILKQETTEKIITHKYEVSEALQRSEYKSRSENALALQGVKEHLEAMMGDVKNDLHIRIDRNKVEFANKIAETKEYLFEKFTGVVTQLKDLVSSRIRIVSVVAGGLMGISGWVWIYAANTEERVDNFRSEIQIEFAEFKAELKDLIVTDIQRQIDRIERSQAKLEFILEMHDKSFKDLSVPQEGKGKGQ